MENYIFMTPLEKGKKNNQPKYSFLKVLDVDLQHEAFYYSVTYRAGAQSMP